MSGKCKRRSKEEDVRLFEAFSVLSPLPTDPPEPVDPCWFEQANVWKLEEEIEELKAKLVVAEAQLDMWQQSLTDCQGGVIV